MPSYFLLLSTLLYLATAIIFQLPPAGPSAPIASPGMAAAIRAAPPVRLQPDGAEIKRAFDRDGYVLLRGAVAPEVVQELRRAIPARSTVVFSPLELLINWMLGAKTSQDSIWAAHEAFGRFWFDSTVGAALARVMGAADIRLLTDFVVEVSVGVDPVIFGRWHRDTTSFDVLHDDAQGYSVWIPVYPIDVKHHGGSLYVVNTSKLTETCRAGGSSRSRPPGHGADLHADAPSAFTEARLDGLDFSPECQAELEAAETAYDFAIGDALVFGKRTIHRTQRLTAAFANRTTRAVLIGRFFDGSKTKYRRAPHGNGPPQRKNSCPGLQALEPGQLLRTACAPQVWPASIPAERAAWAAGSLGHKSNDYSAILQVYKFLTTTLFVRRYY